MNTCYGDMPDFFYINVNYRYRRYFYISYFYIFIILYKVQLVCYLLHQISPAKRQPTHRAAPKTMPATNITA